MTRDYDPHGPTDAAIVCALAEHDMNIEDLQDAIGAGRNVYHSKAAIYRALRRLRARGLIVGRRYTKGHPLLWVLLAKDTWA